jgi:hypothetical protein
MENKEFCSLFPEFRYEVFEEKIEKPLELNLHANTTRKIVIRGVQILAIRGVQLYATSTTPLVQSYPWRTACTPRLS